MCRQVVFRWRVLGVLGILSVCRLANGRLECPNKRRLCAGRGRLLCWNVDRHELGACTREGYVQKKGRLQCWKADGQELGASGEGFRGFKGLKAGKRQARMP